MNDMIPAAEFKKHIMEYSLQVWPLLLVAYILAIISVILIFRKKNISDKIISSTLAYLWLLDGIVHQWILGTFPPSQKYTIVFLFSLQGILFLIYGVLKPSISYEFKRGPYSVLGIFFILYSLVFYPVIGFLTGFGFPEGPVMGLICPTTIFTFGILLFTTPKFPKFLLIIPFVWAFWGGVLAIVFWHVWGDIGLVSAGVTGTLLLGFRKKTDMSA